MNLSLGQIKREMIEREIERQGDDRVREREREMIDIYGETEKCVDAERYSYTSYWFCVSGEP